MAYPEIEGYSPRGGEMIAKGLIALCALAVGVPALAEDVSEQNRSYIQEHQKLSELHSKAAECLNSKSLDECKAEISKDCPAEVGDCAWIFDRTSSGGMRDAVREGSESGVESTPSTGSEPLPSDSGSPESSKPDDVNR